MTDINKIARKYVGAPYQHNGRTLEGLDCLGLIHCFLSDNGVCIPDTDGQFIPSNWYKDNPYRFMYGLEKYAQPVDMASREPLDIILFEYKGIPRHSGVLIDCNNFIHILENRKVTIERLTRWRNRIYRIMRVTGGEVDG